MKKWILALTLTGLLGAQPTESREWTATNGKTVEETFKAMAKPTVGG